VIAQPRPKAGGVSSPGMPNRDQRARTQGTRDPGYHRRAGCTRDLAWGRGADGPDPRRVWHFEGIVTPADILATIAGVFRSDREDAEAQAVPRDDGSWLLAGSMPADEMADQLGITLPAKREYHTLAGFVLAHLRHLPATGEAIEVSGWRFEVVDLDGRRIDKVLAIRLLVSRRML
jgi:Transporter associated domain